MRFWHLAVALSAITLVQALVSDATISECNFESGTFCDWSQDKNDDFDWRLQQRMLASNAYAPLDHTTNSVKGRYLFIGTEFRNAGSTARLTSVEFQGGHTRLEFYYHMSGEEVGSLNVYSHEGGQLEHTFWSKKGDAGGDWNLGFVQIYHETPFQIVFEVTVGSGLGGIALDDIKLVTEKSEDSWLDPGACDFESGFCAFTNTRRADDFNWTRRYGGTGSANTGPSSDHTLGNRNGHYVYTEASGKTEGDKARLVGYNNNPTTITGCVSFWYHMKGSSTGSLQVLLKTPYKETPIWVLHGEQGDYWNLGRVEIPPQIHNYQIVFEGVRGNSFLGDIALDDINQSHSRCQTVPASADITTKQDPVG